MPNHQGFRFSDFYLVDVVGSSFNYGAHSGDFALVDRDESYGVKIEKTDYTDFTFGGLWAKRWDTAPDSGGVASLFGTIKGFNNGLEVWSISTALNGSYQFIGGQTQAIDALHFGPGISDHHRYSFLVDDVYLNQTPVPEPETYAMLLAGLALVCFAVKRREN